MLLGQEDINPNTVDTEYGQTPLLWAARGGHKAIVKLLLEREDIDPNTGDTRFGRAPLAWAAYEGHEDVVQLLLERGDLSPGVRDHYGKTALDLAVSFGYTKIQLLLGGPKSPSSP